MIISSNWPTHVGLTETPGRCNTRLQATERRNREERMTRKAGTSEHGMLAAAVVVGFALSGAAQAADEAPLTLARDGYFYVGGRPTVVDGRTYVSHQMYVEVRIPAQQTHRYPIVMVHGGTMSGTNF